MPESLNVEGDLCVVCIHVEDSPVADDCKGKENKCWSGRFAGGMPFREFIVVSACLLSVCRE